MFAWGWFKLNKIEKYNAKPWKITTLISGVPSFEQGLYFRKKVILLEGRLCRYFVKSQNDFNHD